MLLAHVTAKGGHHGLLDCSGRNAAFPFTIKLNTEARLRVEHLADTGTACSASSVPSQAFRRDVNAKRTLQRMAS